jgi:hypothetical protein
VCAAHVRRRPHPWNAALSRVARLAPGRLLRFVQLSSERTLEPVRQDSSLAEKQESDPALLVVVRADCAGLDERDVRFHARVTVAEEDHVELSSGVGL